MKLTRKNCSAYKKITVYLVINAIMPKAIGDLTGSIYGQLTVKEKKIIDGKIYWECLCSCGKEHTTSQNCLRTGRTKSCGCLRKTPPNKNSDREAALLNHLFNSTILKRCKKRGYTTDITFELFKELIKKECFYCGSVNTCFSNDRFGRKSIKTSDTVIYFNGIDRINSKDGYFINNVVPCCKHCNTAKNTFTQQEFKDWIKKAYLKFGVR